MSKNMLAKRAAFAAMATTFGYALFAQPASAQQVDAYLDETHVAVDNSPGNGAKGWVFVYAAAGAWKGSIEYNLYDGSSGKLSADRGQSKDQNTASPIKGFRACNSVLNPFPNKYCGDSKYFG
jgi:hypothetical protein